MVKLFQPDISRAQCGCTYASVRMHICLYVCSLTLTFLFFFPKL